MADLIPAARYIASIHDFSTGASAVKGTPFVKMGFKIKGGEYDGRVVDKFFWMSDNAIAISAKDLVTLGYTGEDPLSDFGNAKSLADVPGTFVDVNIVVAHREYNGNPQVEVKYINALHQPAPPVTSDQKVSFKNAFAEARRAQAQGPTSAGRAPAPQPMVDPSEVPF